MFINESRNAVEGIWMKRSLGKCPEQIIVLIEVLLNPVSN